MGKRRIALCFFIFAFFLVVIIPMQIISFLFVDYGRSALVDEIGRSTASSVQYQMDEISGQVEHIEASLVRFLMDDRSNVRSFLAKYNSMSSQKRWLFLREIIDEMDSIAKSNPLMSEIELYYSSLKLMVSSQKGVWTKDNLSLTDELRMYSSQQPLMQSDDGFYVSYVFSLENPLIYVKAKIPDKNIRDVICSQNSFNNYGFAFYSLSADRLVQNNMFDISEDQVLSLLNDNDFLRNEGMKIVYYGSETLCCMVRSDSLNAIACVFIPLDEIHAVPRRLQRLQLLYLAIWLPILLAIISISLKWMLRPIGNMLYACDAVAGNRYDQFIPEDTPIREFADLIVHFNAMIFYQGNLVNTILQQELYAQKSELKHLQAQINPHFLYNSFFMLRHMISNEENDNAQRLCDYLGGYFKYITDSVQQKVTFLEEFDHAMTYIQIQHMRFPKRFLLDIEGVPLEIERLRVPRLILQPIFENAIVHGFRTMSSGAIFRVSFCVKTDFVTLFFEDNGDGLTDETIARISEGFTRREGEGEITGLSNIHRRLQLEFGPSAGLTARRGDMGGLLLEMKIPIDVMH